MRRILIALAFLAASPAYAAQGDHPALHQLFADEWERGMRDSPEGATAQGDHRFNDRWSDMSLKAIAGREQADKAALARLQKIDRAALSETDRLNYDTFEWQLKQAVARQQYREHLIPMGMSGGVQTLDGTVEMLPFRSEKDYQDWLARLNAMPALVDQTIILMQEGVKQGIMPPAVLMQRVSKQIAKQVVTDPAQSAFYKPFIKFPDSFTEQQKTAMRRQAVQVIRDSVVPAYARLGKFFDSSYLPKSRTTIGASALPNGKAYYDFLAAYFTTTNLSADAIHATGLSEVARIRARMEEVKQEAGFKGTLEQFFTFLRTDPQFFYKSGAELLQSYQAMSKRIDPELVKVFSVLPRLPYGVRPIPENIAPDTTTAYYLQGAADGTRAGFYYVNLYKPEVRPIWEMMALSLHEAVPGHHLSLPAASSSTSCRCFARRRILLPTARVGVCTQSSWATTWGCTPTRMTSSAS